MKVALLSYHYPPSPSVGGLRAEKVARALARAGHEVKVIVAERPAKRGQAPAPGEKGLYIHTVRPLPGPRDAVLAVKRRFDCLAGHDPGSEPAQPDPAADEIGESEWPSARTVPTWKRWIFSFLWLPDEHQGFILPAVIAGWRAIRAGADLLYTTAPPHSVSLAGLVLKWLTGVRWIIELRDPWTDNPAKAEHHRSRASDRLERWLEQACLRSADGVVAVSDGIRQLLMTRLSPPAATKTIVVRNGIDRLVPPREVATHRPLRVVHVGTFYHRRDPRPFLEALAIVCRRRGLSREDIRVDLVGRCRWFHDVSVEAAAHALGLDGVVHFHDWVPRAEAQRQIEHADLLLLLALEQPTQIPNKLYDYLGARVPILALADADGETASLLRQVGGHHIVSTTDPGIIAEALDRALPLEGRCPGTEGDAALLHEWTTERQMARLVAFLDGERPQRPTRTPRLTRLVKTP
ncbi:MAG TPA: glycosyltransferase family 4 protein [Gemmatimonadales bacterium]|nr:glycosyltransferase family 4 protein [Gemmatimonadales bacterium]